MLSKFSAVLEKVPPKIRLNSKEFITDHMAVFEPSQYVFDRTAYFDHYHFIIFFSSPPLCKVGSKDYQFHRGRLTSFAPGMDLTVLPSSSNEPSRFLSLSLNQDFFESISVEATDRNKIEFAKIENSINYQLLDLINNFKTEMLNYGEKFPLMINSISTQIAFQLLRIVDKNTTVSEKEDFTGSLHYINSAKEFIHDNYFSNISIDEICREIYVSRAHFARMFKHQTGQTPFQYLIGIRIKKAKEMLKRDGFSIEEISKLCGFINLSHFSTTFKKLEGICPSKYRKKQDSTI